jgi:hypothetical protein
VRAGPSGEKLNETRARTILVGFFNWFSLTNFLGQKSSITELNSTQWYVQTFPPGHPKGVCRQPVGDGESTLSRIPNNEKAGQKRDATSIGELVKRQI